MDYRQFGRSGLRVPVLSLGTGTFGGSNEFFERWGRTDVAEASRMVDLCLDAGVNFFDTADIYSQGASEEILGQALKGKRDRALISTKATFPMGEGPNDKGSSRYHLVRACEASLKRLGTDHIDVYFMHGFDALTPVDETLRALDDLVRAGKIGYIGASNFSGWQLMKALGTSERYGLARYVAYQGYYSLVGRHYEWELMPLGLDQGVALMVWSPLGWGRLTGKIRRGANTSGRIAAGGAEGGPPVSDEALFRVVDVLDELAAETGRSVAQVALNWLLSRPTVANIVIGARNEEQLKQNLGAVGWSLDPAQIARLDAASHETPIYPYWHQKGFDERNPKPTTW
ncbi:MULTISPECIES: aldo/keto reductase [Methylobacterium]|jgi:aryl-alcohol dehydrogenase-like predicted oxidoreductase|uniref:aldo/keto reductase n=1 Tax=Methylobacterium TaxID=407 RepID=UPI0008E5F092|nr:MULTISPECIES: aldo/keto reductase [Methylobacterium]MBZ6415845.1 aldo/keto reductase [Methylobacterium sp.]MBK3395186.1 aldo/keto reductase [Methylobacterium ajmalii]MBK3411207.1 aldo/keto reductase [Methylobacterium ajmalii]MBK3426294.1 aldo/keto reductase [Methylobacterium ajmalii]SFF39759.1 Predicted oxidoreductase [Methylobacterium sp. yr596]